jgi:hypothetical protein
MPEPVMADDLDLDEDPLDDTPEPAFFEDFLGEDDEDV